MKDPEVYIKIMAEQGGASPVWNINGSNMEIEDYPLAPEIARRLQEWNAKYAAFDFFNDGDLFNYEGFAKEGEQIARHIKAAHPDWQVMYFNESNFNGNYKHPLVEIK